MIRFLRLQDVCSKIVDCPHESPEWLTEGIPVIRNFNLVNGSVDMSECYYVDEETYKRRIKREKPIAGDVIFSREAPIGNCGIVPPNFQCCLGQRLVLLRANPLVCSPEYLLAVLLSDYVQKQINKVSVSGSIVSNYAISDLRNLIIPIIEDAEKIAQIDSTIRNKIANNKNIEKALNELIHQIYDYWFLQFDFPDKNGKPYKSSGGEMVWNEALQRKIPDGWEPKRLCNISEYASDKVNNAFLNEENYVGTDNLLPNMKGKRPSEFVHQEGYSTAYKEGDVLIGNIRPYFQKIWLADNSGGCSADVLNIRGKQGVLPEFLYATLAREDFFRYDTRGAKGSKMPRGDKDYIMQYPVPFNQEVAAKYAKIVKDYVRMKQAIYKENRELESLRDFLLPMLMNGQVKIKL